tara:strand:+ start:493 stop:744 length:252 start_codon:yes stop_codon:yes gene_type:complete
MELELESYMFLGVTVALSVLGFFLKREARKSAENDKRISMLEMLLAKNDVRDHERWKKANKELEDRRIDVQTLFSKLEGKADK